MRVSTIAMLGAAIALAAVGLTVALAGAAAQQPAQHETATDVDGATHAPPVALSADGQGAVQLTVAEPTENPFGDGGEVDWLEPPARQTANKELLLRQYDVIDFKERKSSEVKILAALDDDTRLEFIETPLDQVIEFLKDQHDISIEFDRKALDDVGIGTDVPITRNLKGISLRSGLQIILADLDLTFIIKNEVLMITTIEAADAHLETHIYSLHRLGEVESEVLAEVIQNAIRPDTWRTIGPPDATSSPSGMKILRTPRLATIVPLPGCLVVTQSQQAHEEITDLLTQLERFGTSLRMLRRVSDD